MFAFLVMLAKSVRRHKVNIGTLSIQPGWSCKLLVNVSSGSIALLFHTWSKSMFSISNDLFNSADVLSASSVTVQPFWLFVIIASPPKFFMPQVQFFCSNMALKDGFN